MATERRRWTMIGGMLVIALAVSGCSMFGQHAADGSDDETDAFAQEEQDPLAHPHHSVLDLLDPEEREAVERSGISGFGERGDAAAETEGPFGPERRAFDREPESKSEKAGKLGISIMSVALSAAAVAAPFFLF
jgi:hypothetical protein